MSHTVIVGAGFGGIAVAYELRKLVGSEHEITLIDRGTTFTMGLRKLWALVGAEPLERGRRPLSALGMLGISVVQAEVSALDGAARTVRTDQGVFQADHLVIALGAETRPDLVPGLTEHGHNIWKASNVPAAAAALDGLTAGRVLVLIAGAPYPCPPAPYECAMLVDECLRERGRRPSVDIAVATVQPLLLPNAGKQGSDWIAAQLAAREISFQTGLKIARVEPSRVVYEDDEDAFDLLLAVAPHRPPQVISDSGLVSDNGWMSVDAGTFETAFPGVYAIGDVTLVRLANGLPLPKAGLIAELEGTRVAQSIAAQILGQSDAPPFDGKGFCFMELGMREAALVEGDFYARPEPSVVIVGASRANAERKRLFELERLAAWFGS